MSLQTRLEALVVALGVDTKNINASLATKPSMASAANRAIVSQTIPGSSPYTYTAPAGQVVQMTVTGGATINVQISTTGPTGSFVTFVGATGAAVIVMPGESCRVTWGTAPTAIRTRVLMTIP